MCAGVPGPSSRAPESGAAPPPTALAKEQVRAAVRARRSAEPLPPDAAAARLRQALAVTSDHRIVACYASMDGEPDTWGLLDALLDVGAEVLLPLLAGRRTPAWARYTGRENLRPGWRGISEPVGDAVGPDALRAATLVWCPALAVTPDGARLGTGGGWYDRALPAFDPAVVAAALVDEADVRPSLPLDPWDRPVDVVVTELRTRRVAARPRKGAVE